MKQNHELFTDEVVKMSIAEFEERFGFKPIDALEKYYFAVTAKQIDYFTRTCIENSVIGEFPLAHVVME